MGLFKGILGQISGKVGGNVFAHNRGGSYLRAWAVPTNPNTPAQQAVRTAMSNLVTDWLQVLSQAQRDAWDTYAANVEMTNRLGDPIFLTGQNQFIRSNVPRVQRGRDAVLDGPTIFNLGELAPVNPVIEQVNSIDVFFDDTEAWADENGSFMFLYQSPPQSQTVNFFKSPFKGFATLAGSSTLPPMSPEPVVSGLNYTVGQKGFFRIRLSRADGRLSSAQITSNIADF